eukprot:5801072-Pyramimonas_sp.AAC.1
MKTFASSSWSEVNRTRTLPSRLANCHLLILEKVCGRMFAGLRPPGVVPGSMYGALCAVHAIRCKLWGAICVVQPVGCGQCVLRAASKPY